MCGYLWPHKNGQCPEKGQTYSKCGRLYYFAKVCFSKCNKSQGPNKGYEPLSRQKYKHKSHVHHVASSEPCQKNDFSSDEYLYSLSGTANSTTPRINVKINDITISMIIDAGASADIMDENVLPK